MSGAFLIEHPDVLWLVWAIPLLAAGYWAAWKWSRKVLARHFSPELIAALAGSVSRARRRSKAALLLAALVLILIALAEPKWGESEQTVLTRGRDMFIVLDVSRSMLATDVAPSRLERVKLDIQDMIAAVKGDRVGLIVFAGTPVLKCPLTTDYPFLLKALDRAAPRSVSRGGTFIGDAIRLAVDSFTDRVPNHKVILLISDGEDQGSYPLEAAHVAADRGIRVYTVGIGDPAAGSRIRVDGQWVTDDGKPVVTRLNPDELRKIAEITGGAYVPAGTRSVDLDRIYKSKIASVEAQELEETKRKFLESRYQLFLALGLILLIMESLISDRIGAPASPAGRAALVVLCALWAAPACGADDGRPDPFDLYNAGRRMYAGAAYDSAADAFAHAGLRAPANLESDAYFNLGNSFFKLADLLKETDINGAIDGLEQAQSAYRESLNRGPAQNDARYNLELARRLLRELKQAKREQEKQQGKGDGGDTGAAQSRPDTSAGQSERKQEQKAGQAGPKDEGKAFNRREAEKTMKEKMKEMEELRRQLMEAARRQGVDPEKRDEQPAGAVIGGGYKDW